MKFCCVGVITIILEKQFCSNVIVFNFICFGTGKKYRDIIKVRGKGILCCLSGKNHENLMEVAEIFFSEAVRTLLISAEKINEFKLNSDIFFVTMALH